MAECDRKQPIPSIAAHRGDEQRLIHYVEFNRRTRKSLQDKSGPVWQGVAYSRVIMVWLWWISHSDEVEGESVVVPGDVSAAGGDVVVAEQSQ